MIGAIDVLYGQDRDVLEEEVDVNSYETASEASWRRFDKTSRVQAKG